VLSSWRARRRCRTQAVNSEQCSEQ
jgi:hypothetical protein